MGPKTARLCQLESARSQIKFTEPSHVIDNSMRFVFSVLAEGTNYELVSKVFLWNDIKIPSRSSFYRAQRIIAPIIIEMANESCLKYRKLMEPGSTITMDGSWGHRRNSLQCILEFIDSRQRKIVDFAITEKDNHILKGDFVGSSNAMEIECLKKLIARWKNDPNVISYTHDNDGKTRVFLESSEWAITEILDTNHTIKSFSQKISDFDTKNDKLLYGLHEKLHRFLKFLIHLEVSSEEKQRLWLNSSNHYSGDHSQCLPHGDSYKWPKAGSPHAKEVLDEFLKKTLKILIKCDGNLSTQLNESYHSLKAKFASKELCWIDSWQSRIAAAILQFNNPNQWKFELYQRLGFGKLSEYSTMQLSKKFQLAESKSVERRTSEYRIQEAKRRNAKKVLSKQFQQGKELYKSKRKKKSKEEISSSLFDEVRDFSDIAIYIQGFERDSMVTSEESIFQQKENKDLSQFRACVPDVVSEMKEILGISNV